VAVSQILPHGSIPITTIRAAQLMITEIALAAPNGGPEPPVLRITLGRVQKSRWTYLSADLARWPRRAIMTHCDEHSRVSA